MHFVADLRLFMERLQSEKKLESWRLMRRKLGLGPKELGEFHLMMEVRDLAQLQEAFGEVSARQGAIEALHFGVNSKIDSVTFALYRDFPDQGRVQGEELF